MTTQNSSSRTRTWIEPEDPSAHGTLFGGSLLRRPCDGGPAPATGGHGSRRAPRGRGR